MVARSRFCRTALFPEWTFRRPVWFSGAAGIREQHPAASPSPRTDLTGWSLPCIRIEGGWSLQPGLSMSLSCYTHDCCMCFDSFPAGYQWSVVFICVCKASPPPPPPSQLQGCLSSDGFCHPASLLEKHLDLGLSRHGQREPGCDGRGRRSQFHISQPLAGSAERVGPVGRQRRHPGRRAPGRRAGRAAAAAARPGAELPGLHHHHPGVHPPGVAARWVCANTTGIRTGHKNNTWWNIYMDLCSVCFGTCWKHSFSKCSHGPRLCHSES